MTTSHWVCVTEDCGKCDEVFSASSQDLAICPSCEQPLKPLDEGFDANSERGRNLAELPDAYLARGLIASLARDDTAEAIWFEAEVRRRYGYRTRPQEWAEAEMSSGKRVYGLTREEGGWGGGIATRANSKEGKKKKGKKGKK